jgi:hypothetical protein
MSQQDGLWLNTATPALTAFEILLAEETKVDRPVPMLQPRHERTSLQAEQDVSSRFSLIRQT